MLIYSNRLSAVRFMTLHYAREKYYLDEGRHPTTIDLRMRELGVIDHVEIYRRASGIYVIELCAREMDEKTSVIYVGYLDIGNYVPESHLPHVPLAEFDDIDLEELGCLYNLPSDELLEIRDLERQFRNRRIIAPCI